jgi:hypothetical protein
MAVGVGIGVLLVLPVRLLARERWSRFVYRSCWFILEPEAQLNSDGKMFIAVVVIGGTITIGSSVVLGFGVACSNIRFEVLRTGILI